ncbi:MAG TPA: 3TM-type holin [Cellvibrio sp.]|nr:3TM-type holin [Cellvibrio sp.]
MSFLTTLFSGGDTVKAIGDSVDNLFTSDEERLEKQNELLKSTREYDYQEHKLVAEQNKAQTEVNKTEAQNSSLFVAGWRPAIGWVGAIALFYQFIAYPLMLWIPWGRPPPAPLDYTMLYTLITGMLGIAGLRSYDKSVGTETKKITK